MSRAKTVLLIILAVLPLVLAAAAFPFLPDTIAFHFGATEVDDWRPKSMVFLGPGITVVAMLLVVWLSWAACRPDDPEKPRLLLLNNGETDVSVIFRVTLVCLILVDASMAVYLGYNLFFVDGASAELSGRMISIGTIALVMLLMWGFAAYLISGRGVHLINGYPGSRESGENAGDRAKQGRAIGFLLLFLSLVTLALVLAPTLMRG